MAKKSNKNNNKFSMVDELERMTSTTRRKWFDDLPESSREVLLEVRLRFRGGRLKNKSLSSIHKFCCSRLGFRVSKTTFFDWLREKPNGQTQAQ